MSNQILVVIGLLLAVTSLATEGYPQEVAEYIERREICEHFRQEPWPEGSSAAEKERRAFIAGQFELYCKGSDQTIRELKSKYKNNQTVIDRLEKYETKIEEQQ
jgi:hypothetical protein